MLVGLGVKRRATIAIKIGSVIVLLLKLRNQGHPPSLIDLRSLLNIF